MCIFQILNAGFALPNIASHFTIHNFNFIKQGILAYATEVCFRVIARFGTGDETLERCWKVNLVKLLLSLVD